MTNIVFNHATVRERADMLTYLRLCSERGLQTVSIWGDEITKVGETDALSVLQDFGMTVSGYNRVGPLNAYSCDSVEAELERAARFEADHVFLFTGGLRDNEKDLGSARRRIEDTIGKVLDSARKIGVKLAIEPLHPMVTGDRSVISSLSHANSLCEALGPGIGVVVDVYHCWWDERLPAEIARAGDAGRLFGFHVNDWLIPTRHLLTDRGMMGDGIIDLRGIHSMMRRAGYDGTVEVEIFSTDWWSRDPAEVMDIAIDRCRNLFSTDEKSWQ
ncbi:xylose isomerase domain-containing protein (plasmid) [Rhizobium sp. NXC14]|uniref:sugar phosphate isomerase/epimerase family protein n=1 Tax=Rhizobium sp. NXC14 TaxID=1981173 RepID=UPI000A201EF2|nr:sugar phosphate isomerase/epimerase family protein [Rhizobium sp. NXC14]ARO34266.1 xylose isomerase domain-containing protein [Rhizobium sp. NXC14]